MSSTHPSPNGVKPLRKPTCSLCRQRKLRCDGGSPCGACFRSRRFGVPTCEYVPKPVVLRTELPKGGACVSCRHRKRKCDGGLPCSTCQTRGHPGSCVYESKPRRQATAVTSGTDSLLFDWDSALAARPWPRKLGTVASPVPTLMKHSDSGPSGSKLASDWPWQTYTQGPLPTMLAGTDSDSPWNEFVPDLDLQPHAQYGTRPGGEVTVVPSRDNFILSILHSLHDSSQQPVRSMPQQDLGTRVTGSKMLVPAHGR
ncbi:hypothetical protein C8F01DRAFT_1257824 [Mycena amicta]|nr:hypothetical protein C8F01DRAFT_1257824 [Mycena amicta]